MTTIPNAAPRAYVTGFNDLGTRTLPMQDEDLPIHLPFYYGFAQRGQLSPVFGAGDYPKTVLGSETFNERSKFFTHQTLAWAVTTAEGNVAYFKRLVADNAKRASMVMCFEVVAADVPEYQRETDGSLTLDVNGDPIPTSDVVDGHLGRFVKRQLTDVTNLRGELTTQGTLVGRSGETSTIYPLFACAMEFGEFGNNLGMTLYQPGPNTSSPADMEIVLNEEAMVYRAVWKQRENVKRTPYVLNTANNETWVEFCLRDGVVNSKLSMDLPASRMFTEYGRAASVGYEPIPAPAEAFYFYQDNIDEVVALLWSKEEAFQPELTNAHQLNIMSATDHNGAAYHSFAIDPSSLRLDASTTHFAEGGADGDTDEATLAQLVSREIASNWSNPMYPLLDDAKFPFSCLYDTGFPLETKYAILDTIGKRPDIHTGVCTQVVGEPLNSISEETAVMTALRAHARLMPESVIHGTSVVRAVAFGQAGTWMNSNYKNKDSVPLLMALIQKRADFMGASNGVLKTGRGYDEESNKVIDTMRNVSHPWKPDSTRTKDWSLGLNWASNADRTSLNLLAVQTLYDQDTSPLNSDINMIIGVDVIKQCIKVWRRMSGNTRLTDPQFAERSDTLLRQFTEGRYEGRVRVVPNTTWTELDKLRGYSWTQNATIYMNNMRTVNTINVTVRRMSDLAA